MRFEYWTRNGEGIVKIPSLRTSIGCDEAVNVMNAQSERIAALTDALTELHEAAAEDFGEDRPCVIYAKRVLNAPFDPLGILGG